MARAALLVAVLVVTCGCNFQPPDPPTPIEGAGCDQACDNLRRFGGCSDHMDLNFCEQDCRRLNEGAKDLFGNPIEAMDTECIAGANSCYEASLCG